MPFFFSSCEVINPEEDIPSYIQIDKISLQTGSPSRTGPPTEKIADAWVYIDGNLIGVFELPATVPILDEGKHDLDVFAGIKKNGIAASREIYPFYTTYSNDSTFTLFRDSVIGLDTIQVQYFSPNDITFNIVEDFEDQLVQNLDSAETSETEVDFIDRPSGLKEVLYQDQVGSIILSESQDFYRGVSEDSYRLPAGGKRVYLEMDYNTTTPLLVGMVVKTNDIGTFDAPVITLLPTTDGADQRWNKIYINLTDLVSTQLSAINYRFFISASHSAGSSETDKILLDNIKIIHF